MKIKLIFLLLFSYSTISFAQNHKFLIDEMITDSQYDKIDSELEIVWDKKIVKFILNETEANFIIENFNLDESTKKLTLNLISKNSTCLLTIYMDGRYKNVFWDFPNQRFCYHYSKILGN